MEANVQNGGNLHMCMSEKICHIDTLEHLIIKT